MAYLRTYLLEGLKAGRHRHGFVQVDQVASARGFSGSSGAVGLIGDFVLVKSTDANATSGSSECRSLSPTVRRCLPPLSV